MLRIGEGNGSRMGLKSSLRSAIRKHWFDKRNFRYHFIHIPKNGGVSVRHALELQSDVSLSKPYHYRYVDIADEVGRQLRFFSVVRNPWSRTASRYHFGRQSARKLARVGPASAVPCQGDVCRLRPGPANPPHPRAPESALDGAPQLVVQPAGMAAR